MSAIEFVVRNDAGGLQRGEVSGKGANANIIVGQSQDVSLNLERSHVLSYARQGQALQVMLVDGEIITIQGFFTPEGQAQNHLYLSSGGQLAEVQLVPGDGNLMLAQYVDSDSFGKWSPDDELYFTQIAELPVDDAGPQATMMAAPLMGGLGGLGGWGAAGAAAVGGALLVGGNSGDSGDSGSGGESGDGGGGTTPTVPTDPTDPTTPTDPTDPTTPTDPTDPTTPTDPTDPTTPTDPTDPTTPTDPTDPTGPTDPTDPTGPTDPTDPVEPPAPLPPVVEITTGTRGDGTVVNNDDYKDGVDIGGTGTPGATGTVTVGTVVVNITIDQTGHWQTTIPAGQLPEGEYDLPVKVIVTNEGGSATDTDTLDVDTVATVTFDASKVETDGTVNFVEETDGVVLNGTTQAGSTVIVQFGGASYNAVVTGTNWSLNVPAGVLPQGDLGTAIDITVTATDSHGNTATVTDTLEIDTITGVTVNPIPAGGDNTVNAAERTTGVTVTGTAEAGATVIVTMANASHTVTANAQGQWTTTYAQSEVPRSEGMVQTVTAVSTDLAGNTDTASGTVRIDTEIHATIDTSDVDGPDGIVNAEETKDGVILHGTADAGATVVVTFNGSTHTVTSNAQGNWSSQYSRDELPTGNIELNYTVNVKATDVAGNTASTTGIVKMDTWVNQLTSTSKVGGDGVLNHQEEAQGITLNGRVEKGSSVLVDFDGVQHVATVKADGTWTVHFTAAEIRDGEYNAVIGIHATDAAGNVRSIEETFVVDTVLPESPDVLGIFLQGQNKDGVTQVAVESADDALTIHAYNASGVQLLSDKALANPGEAGRSDFYFGTNNPVADGKHLVVTATDDHGNTNSTLLVLEEKATDNVDITAPNLDGFDIGAIDLSYAENAKLSLTKATIDALSDNDNVLVIHGAIDDTVTFHGTGTMQGTETINGQAYDVYDVGGDTVIKIDHDIQFVQSIV
ncbi:Ig-like domain-containing protein [Loktanella sp. M215]|uniref:Ig-like domain-containing protein n=1 Tax=Loktanella sp. M215 TaxID=2675431 RepID=UPI001F317B26|nr:Ig-like domain-containing protein [Loktanella sp. M215]